MTALLDRKSVSICRFDDLQPERGVRALVGDSHVAVFRTIDGALFAVDAVDPFSGASVLSRGVVGSHGGRPFVASPMYKQRFDLSSGRCIDEPHVQLRVFAVDVVDGGVVVHTIAPDNR